MTLPIVDFYSTQNLGVPDNEDESAPQANHTYRFVPQKGSSSVQRLKDLVQYVITALDGSISRKRRNALDLDNV